MSRIGTVVAGRYRLKRVLGRGSMGEVYLAHDDELGEWVALKWVEPLEGRPPKLTRRLFREFEALRRVSHPGVVEALEIGQLPDGTAFLTTRFVEGTTLADFVRLQGPLDADVVAEIGAQLCDALAAAHDAGLVHRDIKPANVILRHGALGFQVVVLDFGLVWLDSDCEGARLTATGVAVGTPSYMAPEQVTRGTPDARTDLYAVGCVAVQLLTGEPPFRRSSPMATFAAHMNEPPPAVAAVGGRRLERVVHQLLAKEQAARPANGRAAAAMFRRLHQPAGWVERVQDALGL